MSCIVYEFETSRICGESDLIKNCCYDHAVVCSECNINPAHPYVGVCKQCRDREYRRVPEMSEVNWSDIVDYGDIMTLEEFQDCCDMGAFIDDDGHGYYILDGRMSNISTWPSKFMINRDDRFSHIIWFNR